MTDKQFDELKHSLAASIKVASQQNSEGQGPEQAAGAPEPKGPEPSPSTQTAESPTSKGKPATFRIRGDIEPLKQALDSLNAEFSLHPVIADWATAKELFRFDERPGDFFEWKQAPTAGAKEIVIVCQPTERFLKLVAAIQACNVEQGIEVE